jgi:hypothetical protein
VKKKQIKFWFKNEKELMKSLGLNPTPGSGNRLIKEDGQNEYLIAQLKSTEGSAISIRLTDVNTLLYNAAVTHKLPIFINQFIGGPLLVSMRLEDMEKILELLKSGFTKLPKYDIMIKGEQREEALPIIQSSKVKGRVVKKLKAEREKRYERRKGK